MIAAATARDALADTIPGVVWAYQFDGGGRGVFVRPGEPIVLSDKREGFIWLHIDLVDQRAHGWCKTQPALSDMARNAFLSSESHLRLDHDDGQCWGVLADLAQELGKSTHTLADLRFIIAPGWLITGRRHHLRGASLVREKIEEGHEVASPYALFEFILAGFAEEVGRIVETLAGEINALEERAIGNPARDESQRLGTIRRRCLRINGHLFRLLSALRNFTEQSIESKAPEAILTIARRLLQRGQALHHEIDAIQARARLIQEEATERRAAEMNSHLYILSILTALLMPPTLVFGMFGMNTGGLPLVATPYGFAAATFLALISAATVLWLLHRVRKSNHAGLR
jgi:zinc transporter